MDGWMGEGRRPAMLSARKKKPGSERWIGRTAWVSQVPSDANCLTHLSEAPPPSFFFLAFFHLYVCKAGDAVHRPTLLS